MHYLSTQHALVLVRGSHLETNGLTDHVRLMLGDDERFMAGRLLTAIGHLYRHRASYQSAQLVVFFAAAEPGVDEPECVTRLRDALRRSTFWSDLLLQTAPRKFIVEVLEHAIITRRVKTTADEAQVLAELLGEYPNVTDIVDVTNDFHIGRCLIEDVRQLWYGDKERFKTLRVTGLVARTTIYDGAAFDWAAAEPVQHSNNPQLDVPPQQRLAALIQAWFRLPSEQKMSVLKAWWKVLNTTRMP